MLSGTYGHPTVFHFGLGMELKVGGEVKKFSPKVLFHYGKKSIKENGLYERVRKSLTSSQVEVFELGGVEPNPKRDLVYEGIDKCRAEAIDFILAVGGGSVIDSAKAISTGVPYEGDFFDFFEGKRKPVKALKIGVIVTIPGSGSESSSGAVITDPATKSKAVLDDPLLIPIFAILTPEFTTGVPKFLTACGIVDAMGHIFERYFTNTQYVDCTDRICEGLLQTLMKYAALVQEDPQNMDIRSEIMWACKLAHDSTPGFGRKQDWGCHKISHEIGVATDAAHGAIVGIVFLAWFRFISRMNKAKLVQFGQRVFGVKAERDSEAAIQTITNFECFLKNIGMPTSFREIGFTDKSAFWKIAQGSVRSMESGTVGNYIRLEPGDIVELLEIAY